MQARCVVRSGEVVGGARRGARRIDDPRRRAGDDAADDGAHLRDLLVTLAVAEVRAARDPVRARAAGAAAPALHAVRTLVAVHVVPRCAVAEPGTVGLPPTGGHGPERAAVVAGQRA